MDQPCGVGNGGQVTLSFISGERLSETIIEQCWVISLDPSELFPVDHLNISLLWALTSTFRYLYTNPFNIIPVTVRHLN